MFLRPDYNIESIYDLDIYELKRRGIKALFFDLDSTLMKSKSGKFSFQTLQFLNDLKTNFKLAIITNNKNKDYIDTARAQIDIPIYSNAKKPNPQIIYDVCCDFNIEPKEAAMIGDRPLSDILAGIRAQSLTVLVDSISKNDENFLVRFVRYLERLTIDK